MTTDTVTLFLALLSVVAELAVAATVMVHVAARISPTGARWKSVFVDTVGPQALVLAFFVAAISMSGSLYFSEAAHFTPCKLCWYQRIAMYPLVPVLGLAAWRRDDGIRPYAAALAALGASVSVYHVLLERFPSLESGACDVANPCTIIWVRRFGYLTIPTMALSAFALIVALMLTRAGQPRRQVHLEGESDADHQVASVVTARAGR
jgi:disulfide bond formation protein DsbB